MIVISYFVIIFGLLLAVVPVTIVRFTQPYLTETQLLLSYGDVILAGVLVAILGYKLNEKAKARKEARP